MGACFALVMMAWSCGCKSGKNPGKAVSNATQFVYATARNGQIGTTQTIVTAFHVETDGSLTSEGTAFTLGPGVTTWETLALQTADRSGHHVFGIESVTLLQAPFPTTYSLVTFAVQPSTGALTQTSSLNLPYGPTTVTLSPDGTFLFVGLFAGPPFGTSIATYSVDADGNLKLLTTVTTGFQFAVYATVVNPTGTFLYAIGGGPTGLGMGVQFAIDPTGALSQVGTFDAVGTPFGGGSPGENSAGLLMTPSGAALYSQDQGLKEFEVDPDTGSLAEGITATCSCFNITMNAQGTLLFAGASGTTNQPVGIRVFSIDPITGGLMELSQSFIAVTSFDASVQFVPWMVSDSNGKFLYTTAFGLSNILEFSIGDDGSVTGMGQSAPVTGAPFSQLGSGNLTLASYQQ